MRNFFFLIFMTMTLATVAKAQEKTVDYDMGEAPGLEFVFEIRAEIGEAYQCGEAYFGTRNIIPITGGTFSGPAGRGTIIPGGADHQLVDKATGRTQLEAIYTIRTDDGVNIHVRNVGILNNGPEGFYFRTAPKFEAPRDSKYGWLNESQFLNMICAYSPSTVTVPSNVNSSNITLLYGAFT